MRPALLALGLLLVAPLALAHGSGHLHLSDLRLAFHVGSGSQEFAFTLTNDATPSTHVKVRLTLAGPSLLREEVALPDLAAGESVQASLHVPMRASVYGCVHASAFLKSSDQVCAFTGAWESLRGSQGGRGR